MSFNPYQSNINIVRKQLGKPASLILSIIFFLSSVFYPLNLLPSVALLLIYIKSKSKSEVLTYSAPAKLVSIFSTINYIIAALTVAASTFIYLFPSDCIAFNESDLIIIAILCVILAVYSAALSSLFLDFKLSATTIFLRNRGAFIFNITSTAIYIILILTSAAFILLNTYGDISQIPIIKNSALLNFVFSFFGNSYLYIFIFLAVLSLNYVTSLAFAVSYTRTISQILENYNDNGVNTADVVEEIINEDYDGIASSFSFDFKLPDLQTANPYDKDANVHIPEFNAPPTSFVPQNPFDK